MPNEEAQSEPVPLETPVSSEPVPVPPPTEPASEPVVESLPLESPTESIPEAAPEISEEPQIPSPQKDERSSPSPAQASEPVQSQTAPPPAPKSVNNLLIKARATIQARKRKKLDWIMEHVGNNGSITNDKVQEHFRVGDTTATRYLTALMREGKLKRIGTTGKAVRYEKA